MSRGVALSNGLLVTLATPVTWPLALAAFLLRGGIVLFLLPIVVLPTPVGIGNTFGPTLTAIALGSMPTEALIGGGVAVLVVLAWLGGAGLLAAALEAEGARVVAAEQDVAGDRVAATDAAAGGRTAGRILAARLVAYIPLLVVLSWGMARLVVVTYDELTSPQDVSMPIVLRVLLAAPEVVAAIVIAWMVGEMVGAVAARRIVLAGDGVGRALVAAVGTCLRHPASVLARFWIPTVVLLVVVTPSVVASASAWSTATGLLDDLDDPVRVILSVIGLVFLWVVGLLLVSVISAWRAAVWTTAEMDRQGTFGGSADRRPGDWRPEGTSATL